MKTILISLCAASPLLCHLAFGQEPHERCFQNPPDSARVQVWWHWMNGNVSKEGITKDLEYMKQVGVGGLQHFDLDQYIPAGPVQHNSDRWHELMGFAVSEAHRLKLEFGFNQCSGWSNSGGVWIEPQDSMKTVVWTERKVEGGELRSIELRKPRANLGFYRDIAVLAFPTPQSEVNGEEGFRINDWKRKSASFIGVNDLSNRFPRDTRQVTSKSVIASGGIVDITSKMSSGGLLEWRAPAGVWTVIRFGYTTTGMSNHPASNGAEGLECDKLSRAGLDKHWDSFVERVITDGGRHAPETLTTVLLDSYEVAQQNWTDRLREEFQERRGYDLLTWLPCMTGRVVDSLELSERFLWDLRRTISDLMAENYFGYFAELCHERGLKFAAEPYGSGYFDSFDAAMSVDLPMGEFWTDNAGWARYQWSSSRLAASAAHVTGKPVVGAEAFTSSSNFDRWSTSPAELKQLGDLMYTHGVNRFFIHGAVHQPWRDHVVPGMTMGPWGMHLSRNNTWSPHARAWFDYMARCQYILQQGRFVADLLYVYNEDSPNINDPREMMEPSPPTGFDYDSCNFRLLRSLDVQDGVIVCPGGVSYRALVLPYVRFTDRHYRTAFPRNASYMRPETLHEIKRLVDSGATVLAERPLGSPSLQGYPECDDEVRSISEELWSSGKVDAPDRLPQVLTRLGLKPDFESPSRDELAYIHRTLHDGEYYFVSNQSGHEQSVLARFRVDGMLPELWDPLTGKTEAARNWRQHGDGRTEVTLELEPAGSTFVVFRQPTSKQGERRSEPQIRDVKSLGGPWEVEFGRWGPQEPVTLKMLASWGKHPDEAVRFYSGSATYRKTFSLLEAEVLDAPLILDLGEVAVLAEVMLNGRDVGTVWHPPYRLDISNAVRTGDNELAIRVTNQWANRLIGDARYPPSTPLNVKRPYGRWRWQGSHESIPKWVRSGAANNGPRKTFTTFELWNQEDPLRPSGLMGPVRILHSGASGI